MKKAQISLTILLELWPSDVGLDDDCAEADFESACEEAAQHAVRLIEVGAEMVVNDIEMDIMGFE